MLKFLVIVLLLVAAFFVVTFTIYFFNLDMKLTAALTKPLLKWYDWSGKRRKEKAEKPR